MERAGEDMLQQSTLSVTAARHEVGCAIHRAKQNEQRPRAGSSWTSEEVALLIKLYPTYNNRELATRFGRSEWAVAGKARGLGLTRDHGRYRRQPSRGRPWSSQEIDVLRRLYGAMADEDIAVEIGRTRNAVAIKAKRLKLRKMRFWTDQEDRYLRACHREQTCRQMARVLGRTAMAVRTRAITLGLEVKVPNWTEDEIDWLKDSYGRTDLNVIAAALGRTRAAVAKKAREMGLVKFRHWSQEETRRLREWLPRYTRRDIACRLDRSLDSVRYKIRQLGLREQPECMKPIRISSKHAGPRHRNNCCEPSVVWCFS
jgi:hypothetical protein